MKSSLPEAGRHEDNLTRRDAPIGIGAGSHDH